MNRCKFFFVIISTCKMGGIVPAVLEVLYENINFLSSDDSSYEMCVTHPQHPPTCSTTFSHKNYYFPFFQLVFLVNVFMYFIIILLLVHLILTIFCGNLHIIQNFLSCCCLCLYLYNVLFRNRILQPKRMENCLRLCLSCR